MARTVRYVTYERHSVKYIALNDGQWFDSWDKHKTDSEFVMLEWNFSTQARVYLEIHALEIVFSLMFLQESFALVEKH